VKVMTRALVLLLVVAIVALATPTLAAPKCDDPRVIEMMLSQQFSPPFETGKPIDRAAF
jgi:hypothetical protein